MVSTAHKQSLLLLPSRICANERLRGTGGCLSGGLPTGCGPVYDERLSYDEHLSTETVRLWRALVEHLDKALHIHQYAEPIR